MVLIEFRPLGPTDMFRDGWQIKQPHKKPGFFALYDLRQSWAGDMRDPFDNVSMFLPISTVQELAAERNQTFSELRYDAQDRSYDEVSRSSRG